MEDKIIQILLDYKSSYNNCIYENEFKKITKEIMLEFNLSKAELEAKVYTYEKIISNSNFKAILEDNKTKKKTKKGEGEDNGNY